MHWTAPLLGKLNAVVKLVGPTIRCPSSPCALDGAVDAGRPPMARNPYVQGVWATDRAGLRVRKHKHA